ncbi:MAG TPA: PHP domain-containing protein, partial [Longimicrobiaceae bacterium]|nr:PHP domain-containing protein [Longimicrobiaceae bacterium]
MADAPRPLRLDMHVHTRSSKDSLNPYAGIVPAMDAAGIDRAVISDHDRIEGALRMAELAPERILVGEEVKTREGPDLIGILLTELIPRGTPIREACEIIRAQGGVVYVPHPFDNRRSGAGELLEEIADLVDVVEAHNARTYRPELNERGEAWARERGVALGAGSDAHTLAEIGTAYVEVPPFAPTRDSLLAALRAGRIAARGTSSRAASLHSTYARVHKV